jgi:Ca-activated chloride channel family protein
MKTRIEESELTSFALGEVAEDRRREIEAWLEEDPAARGEVEQIREMAGVLKEGLGREQIPVGGVMGSMELARARMGNGRRRRVPWMVIAAAACVVIGGTAVNMMGRRETRSYTASGLAQTQPATNGRRNVPTVGALDIQPQATVAPSRETAPLPSIAPAVSATPTAAVKPGAANKLNSNTTVVTSHDGVDVQYGDGHASELASRNTLVAARPQKFLGDRLPRQAGEAEIQRSKSVRLEIRTNTNETGAKVSHETRSAEYALVSGDAVQLPSDDNKLSALPEMQIRRAKEGWNTESYDRVVDNPFLAVGQNPLSTFSIDVDTAAYSNVRRFLNEGRMPPKDAVRIEEMVNYFPYDYEGPKGEEPFAAAVEVAGCPWNSEHRLVRVGIKGKIVTEEKRPASNLVFLLDVSGSMNEPNKLPLVKRGMKLLVEQLREQDRVAIVVYAGNSGLVLPSTSCGNKETVLAALDRLEAGGSTNGAQGIELAYSVAASNFIKEGINRVILCTDGDFNVGVTNQGDLTRLIEERAKGGVFLSVLGFGMGNLKDSTMEKLADKGNGNYAYIDTFREARKVLGQQMSGTLVTIAKDVKIQVEFNPAKASEYRLIGYENRMLAKEDFNDDKKDAGEIGAGHTVTALYEVTPAGAKTQGATPAVDGLKYQTATPATVSPPHAAGSADELLTVKLRFKKPDGEVSTKTEIPVTDEGKGFEKASKDFKFATAVAGFGMVLRESPYKGTCSYATVLEWAQEGKGEDSAGYRGEFLELIRKAKSMSGH